MYCYSHSNLYLVEAVYFAPALPLAFVRARADTMPLPRPCADMAALQDGSSYCFECRHLCFSSAHQWEGAGNHSVSGTGDASLTCSRSASGVPAPLGTAVRAQSGGVERTSARRSSRMAGGVYRTGVTSPTTVV